MLYNFISMKIWQATDDALSGLINMTELTKCDLHLTDDLSCSHLVILHFKKQPPRITKFLCLNLLNLARTTMALHAFSLVCMDLLYVQIESSWPKVLKI